jgi:hypothetical protein
MLLDYYCSIDGCNRHCDRYINNHLFHKHKYCMRCRRLFKHILKLYDECEKVEKWWRENFNDFSVRYNF